MTKQDFILCCSLFEKCFKGKSSRDILDVENLIEYKLEQPIFKFSIQLKFGTYTKSNNTNIPRFCCILYYHNKALYLNGYSVPEKYTFKHIKDFLNCFKIHLEDIV